MAPYLRHRRIVVLVAVVVTILMTAVFPSTAQVVDAGATAVVAGVALAGRR